MDNMQLLHESRDAKQDYSAQRCQRRSELDAIISQSSSRPFSDKDNNENNEFDPAWEQAMQASVEPDDSIVDDYDGPSPDVASIISAGRDHGFYNSDTSSTDFNATFLNRSTIATDEDWQAADAALNFLLKQREHYYMQNNIVPLPFSTNINAEIEKAKLHYAQDNHMDSHFWNKLSDWQQLAIALINKYGLNEWQKLAFLLLADAVMKQCHTYQNSLLTPFQMLVTGPGGTGKSQIFKAWSEFHRELKMAAEFQLTAPTGVVASDIGSSTIHSEAALRVKRQNMKADTPGGQKVHAELEQHIGLLRTLVVDEIYFIEPSDISLLNEYCCLARGIVDYPFGGLNVVACGNPAQLPPPGAPSLFDQKLVQCFESNHLNALNEKTQYKVKGIQAWHQLDHVVELTEIMWQKGDDILIDMLQHLRLGSCTEEDKRLLDQHVLSDAGCSEEIRALTDITRWITDPVKACPLITYTNAARDAHNFECAREFAEASGQAFQVYHSVDTQRVQGRRQELKGAAAEAAWQVPVKRAKDLGGKVPLVPGMPVFGTENLAPELGISKGSQSTLVSVRYEERDGHYYAVSATVDFPAYNGNSNRKYLHHIILKPISQSFKFKLPNSDREYSATRNQILLIPAFACTSHNAQGRSIMLFVLTLQVVDLFRVYM
uniref:ATP-dependent DNA helicase n=2 Tax=Moniliophthora roreri TaxID=221103 RepID=A0A0W0FV67_MONRR